MVQPSHRSITTSALLLLGQYVNLVLRHASGASLDAWTPDDQNLPGISSGSAGLKRLDKLPATMILSDVFVRSAPPEPKAGMLWLHFEQIHRIAIVATVSMGRSRALPVYDFVFL